MRDGSRQAAPSNPSRRHLLRWTGAVSALAFTPAALRAAAPAIYKDPRAPVDLRVRDLMARMTLDEKVAQLTTLSRRKREIMTAGLAFDPAKATAAHPNGIGQIARPSDRGGAATATDTGAEVTGRWRKPADTIAFVNAGQAWSRERTRLGIPILFHEESLHGYMAPEATSFPQAIALAGSFDRELMRRVQAVIGREVRAHGTVLALSPVVDIARDPRWGRIEETFGEDAYLCGEMGVAAVRGLQGDGHTLAPGKVFATLKHMTGHGQPESGENVAPAPIAERELRERFFPPFRKVVTQTGIGAVMPSYNEIDGVPSHANRWLLHDVLRGEWGFDGAVVSDYAAIGELATFHHIAADLDGAARLALVAGVDSDLPDGEAYRGLADQVRAGKVSQAAIDAACARMLTMKFRAGLFEAGPVDPRAAARLTANAEALALAREAAHKSIALLVNDGVLPLTPGVHKRVAVIGPNAAVARLGGYSSLPRDPVSLLDGVRAQLAGSFDRELMRRVQAVIGREVRAHGTVLALSPVVDIARDPRWGRIEETFGEDAYLCGEMGVAAVRGLQGDGHTLAPGKVFATLKHMTGHGQPESGENVAPAPIAERELRERFFPPFRKVVTQTGIGAVMPSYNEIDGVPSHANRWLLHDVLRGEWGFDGAVVSDYAAIGELATFHHIAADLDGAARLALVAGVDSDLPDGEAYRGLADQVRAGKVSQAAIDAACARMLTMKFRAGLFEAGPVDPRAAARLTANAEALALAREAAHKSIALLVNDGVLPLTSGAHKRVAVIGPNAAVARLGGYSSLPRDPVSLLEGVRAQLAGKAEVVHAQGVFITRSEDRSADEVALADPEKNRALIAEAVTVAQGADIVLLAIGDTEQTSREGYAKNHLGDRASLDLLGEQNALFQAIKATGKPVVVVAINGRPPSWPTVAAGANALLECWYAGQEGGHAIADVLFGKVNPGAKLPVTVARHVGQLPVFYDAKPSARRGYLFESTDPLFPFGFGLSYTSFTLSPPRLSAPRIGTAASVDVEVDVTNTGQRAGDEVVQLYVRDRVATVTQPIKALKGFERVTLKPGETRTVRLTLGPDAFALWNLDMKEVVEPGQFDIMTGPNSRDLQTVTLDIA